MEYWLKYDKKNSLQLPVPPSGFEISRGNNNSTVNVFSLGEINLIGKGRLASISIASFFPSREYDFCRYKGFPRPYECVAMIERWRKSGKPIRIIITDTDINMPVSIESFNYGENDGTGDVSFTLELKEYKFIKNPSATNVQSQKRPVTKEIPKVYVVKKGDTLTSIAKKLTGHRENYKTIAAKNNIKNPNVIHVGQKLVI
ncbi:MAG TPA: LysM peptidoglycan-binding domain-containing protein [Clostridia bacterium]|nr:LysM peptidoglycan-binding domain-containing protein [Clostridia bacterium]